jgi:hypothetical protein
MTGKTVREELAMMAILQLIPGNHPLYSQLLSLSGIDFADFANRIIYYEASSSDRPDASLDASITALAANAASTSTSKHNRSLIDDPSKCYFCNNGHSFWDCRLFTSAKRAYLERKNARSSSSQPNSQAHPSHVVPKQQKKSEKVSVAEVSISDEITEEIFEFAGQASTSRLVTDPLSDAWISDSGATAHMTHRRDWLFDTKADVRAVKLADGTIIYSTLRGRCRLIPSIKNASPLIVDDVLLVPALSANLFSMTFFSSKPPHSISWKGLQSLSCEIALLFYPQLLHEVLAAST